MRRDHRFSIVTACLALLFVFSANGTSHAACTPPAKIAGGDSYNPTSIQDAYDHASLTLGLSEFTLRLSGEIFSEDLSLDHGTVTLDGGYDCSFSGKTGSPTGIYGKVTVSSGAANFAGDIAIVSTDKCDFDRDLDGFTSLGSCLGSADDCNDLDPDISPGASELCDGIDNNCDGQIDEGFVPVDADGDGYFGFDACGVVADDCNDADATIHPDALDIPYDGIDQDCNGADLTFDNERCLFCHTDQPPSAWPGLHDLTSVPDASCAGCHAPIVTSLVPGHYGRTVLTAGNAMTAGMVIGCESCHDPNSSFHNWGTNTVWPKVLAVTPDISCDTCHENRAARHVSTTAHDNRLSDPVCGACHTSGSAAEVDALHRSDCLTCHNYTGTAFNPETVRQSIRQGVTGSQVSCTNCHNYAGDHHGGGSSASGSDCDACHGHDAGYEYSPGTYSIGAGSFRAHSTHTENDSDDLKGPNIACFFCHDTSNYPDFADGTSSLADTRVCDDCHSPDGYFDGVAMAKANWATGIYENDGTTLQFGNEQWCASCHDEVPAVSNSRLYEVILDDTDATYEGSWTTGSNTDQYADSVHWKQITGVPDGTATWTPEIPFTGEYSVYAWWTVHSNRATDAPYTINYQGGSETVDVNQELNGGQWNYLGTYLFAEGTDGSVVLSNDSAEVGQYVIADAVKFVIGPQGVAAPKVIGDNSSYGYYATGHGRNQLVDCLDCHDAGAAHIDHAARSYDAGVTVYQDSYRLKEVDGQPALAIPRSAGGGLANWRDFALCFECHDRYAVIGENAFDVSQTNFWDADASPNNSHWYHLGMTGVFDSDYDGSTDSAPSCVACHNVHGSPTGPMIRHGELISPPGTTDYVPSFNFYYLTAGDGSATATFTPTLTSERYNVYARWTEHPNRATNAKHIINHAGGAAEVIVNQQQNGDQWYLLGQYDFVAGTSGTVVLTSDGANQYVIADAIGWDRDGNLEHGSGTDPEIVIDDVDASYVGSWTSGTGGSYGSSQHWYFAPLLDPSASAAESVGATMASGGLNSNHVCGTCHSGVTWLRPQIHTGPSILNKEADPATLSLQETCQEVLLTAVVRDADQNIDTVVVDLTTLDGDPAQPMYDDGNYGDLTAGDSIYSYRASVCLAAGSGSKTLLVTATDLDGQTDQGLIELEAIVAGEIVWDDGGADSNWSTPENWYPDGVPGPGTRVAFNNSSSTDCIVDVNSIDAAAVSLNHGYTGTVSLSAAAMGSNTLSLSGDLTVNSGTLLLVGDTSTPQGEGIVIHAPNISIGANGKISADGQGFLSNQGPGAGAYANDQGAGGSHGGRGGDGVAAAHGDTYGSVSSPTALGSGGAYNWSGVDSYGGAGAGAIKLVVSNRLTVDGTLSADGDRYVAGRAGGGAGGSVWIVAGTLAGSGVISADGGIGYATEGGGGGGGRIALDWTSRTFDGTIRAQGGNGWLAGHHGTIWVPADKWNELWNMSSPVSGSIALAPGEYTFTDLSLDNGVTLECQGDSDGEPVNGSGVTINANNINIPANASISADRLGFRSNQGPGAGEAINDQGAGGSYGGRGGDGIAAAHGSTYGSVSTPTALGSGGAYNWSGVDSFGGTGGSAIKLVVSNSLTVDGTLSADGGRYIGGRTGGGAGGSLWLVTGTLAGSGTISADGGVGYATEGGGGGGGRIALDWTSRTFDGIIRSEGGSGWLAGHHGTIWVPADKWNELWNASSPVSGSIALAPGEYTIAVLTLDSGVTLECQGDSDGDPASGSGVTINANNINIPATAALSADRLGFQSNQGPGAGEAISDQGAGGSYGGSGGDGIAAAHGSTYGSVSAPTAVGSGGAYNWSGFTSYGGTGAGAIKLVVSNTLTVDGTLSADGGRYIGGRTGGGSGGSVWVVTEILAGSGTISADGGVGYATEGGGGGGGRIALDWGSRIFDGTIRAEGGSGWLAGHHGTIWVPAGKWNELWDDTYPVTGSIALAPGEYTIAELYLDSGVTLECQGDTDGVPINGSGVTINANNIMIPAAAAISADRLGFRSNQGPGAGTFINDQGAGGSHGGVGGDGVAAPAAAPYGSGAAPTSLGSGGAYNWSGFATYGGTGAGAIKLVASNRLTIDGSVSADGGRYIGGHAGGGSGGSVWLVTDTLAGSGSISADGGIGYATEGGGGGGGRVAVIYTVDSSLLAGATTVAGGSGVANGADGTSLWQAQ